MTHRNADTRIREAFDALRAEIEAVFGPIPPEASGKRPADVAYHMVGFYIDRAQDRLNDFAKLPADA